MQDKQSKSKIVKGKKKSFQQFFSLASALSGGMTIQIDKNTYFDLYKKNADIRQAINKIALWVAKNGLYRETREGEVIPTSNKYDETDIVNKLFGTPTQLFFKKELFKQLLLTGELYVLPINNLQSQLIGFQILDSRTVRKTYGNDGELIGFVQANNKGITTTYTREQLGFYKLENDTDNENDGMGVLEGIIRDALSDLESAKRNYYFFENDATPGGMLLLNDDLTLDESKIAKEQFEASYKGTKNAHKTMVVGGAKEFKTISMNYKDMEFINQRKLTTEKVSACFGVPKSILGYVENTNYSNGQELKKEFVDGTIIPYEQFYEFIINSLLQKFDVKTDYGIIKCDSETFDDRTTIEDAQRKDIVLGLITINEIRVERGLEPYKDDVADKPIIGQGYTLLEDVILDPVIDMSNT